MKILFVGDVHAEDHDLDDCQALIDYVLQIANEELPDKIVFTGDLYHNHAVVHVDVLEFWKKTFDRFNEMALDVVAIVGNHDREVTYAHALLAHSDSISVIDEPTVMNDILYVPFIPESNADEFVRICKTHPQVPTVICHQTFFGSDYGNGFYAKDGINPDLIPQTAIISGHIHRPQEFGKVFYVGSPRWKTLTDANQDRFLWMVNFDAEGRVLTKAEIPTAGICRRVMSATITPETPSLPEMTAKDKWRITVRGPADFVEAKRKELALNPARPQVQGVPETVRTLDQVHESDGIGVAFKKFSDKYVAKYQTPVPELLAMVRERVGI